jgi:hypothetical protein
VTAGQAPEHPSAATVRQDRKFEPQSQPQASLTRTLRKRLVRPGGCSTNGYSLFTALRRSSRTCQIGPGVYSHIHAGHQGSEAASQNCLCLQKWTESMAIFSERR